MPNAQVTNTDSNISYVDLQNVIPLLKPANCPITAGAMYGKIIFADNPRQQGFPSPRKKVITNPIHTFRIGEKLPRTITVKTGLALALSSGEDAIAVDAGLAKYCLVDHIMTNGTTQEQYIVTAVNKTTDTVTFKRAAAVPTLPGQKPRAVITAGDVLAFTGTAKPEGGTGSAMRGTTETTPYTNYAQLFDKSWAVSKTADKTKFHGGAVFTQLQMKHLWDLATDFETAVLNGQPDVRNDSNNEPQYCMGGLIPLIEAYGIVRDIGGALTRTQWDQWLEDAITVDPEDRSIACSGKVLRYIDSWADAKTQLTGEVNSLGVNIFKYKCTLGLFKLFHHPLLDQAWSPADARAYNLDYLTICEMIGWRMEKDVQQPKSLTREDWVYGQYTQEANFLNTGALLRTVS